MNGYDLQKGFSLLEVMVVVVLVSLVIFGIISFTSSQRSEQVDQARILALSQVSQALQDYGRACGSYPLDLAGISPGNSKIEGTCTVNGISYNIDDFLGDTPSELDGNLIYIPLTSTSGGTTCTGFHLAFNYSKTVSGLDGDQDIVSGTAGAETPPPYICDDILTGFNGASSEYFDIVYPRYLQDL